VAASSSHQAGGGSQQAPLATHLGALQRVRLWTDYGEVGEGASLAHYIRAENGSEYIAKGPTFNPQLPYVAANELVCAELAAVLVLPVLDYRLIEDGNNLFFGSSWIEKNKTFYPGIDAALFARAANKNRGYDIVAFDYWIHNGDRNSQNLILRKQPVGGSTAELLALNDHSHALIQAGTTPADLVQYVGAIPPVSLDFLRQFISSSSDLSASISLIEGVDSATINQVVAGVPEPFLAKSERSLVADFLVTRRGELRAMFNSSLGVFPSLGGKKV
jgi:hypothetical protein